MVAEKPHGEESGEGGLGCEGGRWGGLLALDVTHVRRGTRGLLGVEVRTRMQASRPADTLRTRTPTSWSTSRTVLKERGGWKES
jgi:hypothetical protein